MMTVPPLPPGSAITVQSEPDCLTVSWAGRRGIIRRVLTLSGPSVKLLLYRDRLVYTEWPHELFFGLVLEVTSRTVQSVWAPNVRSDSIPRHALGEVRLERSDEAVRLTVRYGVASRVEIGASLGEGDKAWLAEVLRRWIAG
jgi:hypothetical protein